MPVHLGLALGQDAHVLGRQLRRRGPGFDEAPGILQVELPERLGQRGDVYREVGGAVHDAEKDRRDNEVEPFDLRGFHPSELGAGAVPQQDVELPQRQQAGMGVPGRLPEPVFIPALHVAPVQRIAGKHVCRHEPKLQCSGRVVHTSPQVRRNHHSAASSRTTRVNRSGSFHSATAAPRHDAGRRGPLHQLLEFRPVGIRQRGRRGEHTLAARRHGLQQLRSRPAVIVFLRRQRHEKVGGRAPQRLSRRRRLDFDAVGAFQARRELGAVLAGLLGGAGLQR